MVYTKIFSASRVIDKCACVSQGEGFDVMKSGDARVALIGFPSVGKVSSPKIYHCGAKQTIFIPI